MPSSIRSFIVLGTDSGAGQTLVATAIVRSLCKMGVNAVGMKPLAEGVVSAEGAWQSEELQRLAAVSAFGFPAPVGMVCVCVAIASLLAVAPWPYGYYQLLRIVVFIAGIYCGVMVRRSGVENQNLAWALFGAALVFNPFLPVHLPRELWAVLNVAAAGLFGFTAYRAKLS